jgi:hypothetical protein
MASVPQLSISSIEDAGSLERSMRDSNPSEDIHLGYGNVINPAFGVPLQRLLTDFVKFYVLLM